MALPGAVLPGNRRIERTEKMGVVSNGMLCSGDELRLTGDADGILILPADTPLGAPLTDLYGDIVLDVDVKPNRGDALSILGLAREVAAVTGGRSACPRPRRGGGSGPGRRAACRRGPRPRPVPAVRRSLGERRHASARRRTAVQMRLLAAGQRPISNVVDASNYVMLELGKPIHTFDAAAVHAGPDGRPDHRPPGDAGERLETLDHVERELDPETLLIADPRGPLGDRRGHGRRELRGLGRDPRRHRRVRHLRPGQHPPHRASATPCAPRRACASRRARSSASRASAPTGRRS